MLLHWRVVEDVQRRSALWEEHFLWSSALTGGASEPVRIWTRNELLGIEYRHTDSHFNFRFCLWPE